MCGVGFLSHIKGKASHSLLYQAHSMLCNMAHRGAEGADSRDGDGAGMMLSIPHKFFQEYVESEADLVRFKDLLVPSKYAVGNLFFTPKVAQDDEVSSETAVAIAVDEMKLKFEEIAIRVGLQVLFWRVVPTDSSILGPVSKSQEPVILQPFVIAVGEAPEVTAVSADADVDVNDAFERQLYLLRKISTHSFNGSAAEESGINVFYVCSLSSRLIVYKGQLAPIQVFKYYVDLNDVSFESAFALVHSRFSTNTFPSWDRAHPMRWVAHNGEINTLRGNKNWMRSREGVLEIPKSLSPPLSFVTAPVVKPGMPAEPLKSLEPLFPIVEPNGSDSSALDNVVELLHLMSSGLNLPESVAVMIPEALNPQVEGDSKEYALRSFHEWASCIMEPWDGPALVAFCDGRKVGARLDRNGLRPCRYVITSNDLMIVASEVGILGGIEDSVIKKGRLEPGRMLVVDMEKGIVTFDEEAEFAEDTLGALGRVSRSNDFGAWIKNGMVTMDELRAWWKPQTQSDFISEVIAADGNDALEDPRLKAFGLDMEQLNMILVPMFTDGKEALGSMGIDIPLACLSNAPRPLYDYFRQHFAQVTNPPIDPIRETLVMNLTCHLGSEGNLLDMTPEQVCRLKVESPILSPFDMDCLTNGIQLFGSNTPRGNWKVHKIDTTFEVSAGSAAYEATLECVCQDVLQLIEHSTPGEKLLVILSDAAVSQSRAALSSLVSLGGVHHFLLRKKLRGRVNLIVETGEAREVHQFCILVGYGADAIYPYLSFELMAKLKRDKIIKTEYPVEKLFANYIKSANDGIKKVMSKMGISTLQSYKAAQIFECLGLSANVISRCFNGTPSRIAGIDFSEIGADALKLHDTAWPSRATVSFNDATLPESGNYHWRNGAEPHINDPTTVGSLQDAVRNKNKSSYETYSKHCHEQIKHCTLRGMLDFDFGSEESAVPIDDVEPWTEIVKRFCTGAMSYGSISKEAHSTLAIAMNQLGGKSNTGEGGEDPERSTVPDVATGKSMRSAIKQVASGRFGVTSFYLADADELQIKLAQGAKPGEGGELPGHKVTGDIAKTRKSTPGVGLISPPPHHDIYSIEDLKQLIYDLKCANPVARISVKLVSEVGVSVIASGVAKAKAEHILISGHDGGTGASRWTGIKHAGVPWELGLTETHQTLVAKNLRGRVVLQTDGQIKTGRDVAIACLLGAEEWGFATTPLIAMGCTMMRKCHLNTCPVGIATQDEALRKKFAGTSEHVINFFYYVAEELRGIMAKLGYRTINEMVGRADRLKVDETVLTQKTSTLDLSPILAATYAPGVQMYNIEGQDHGLESRLDTRMIELAKDSIKNGTKINMAFTVVNTERTIGATLSYHVSKTHGEAGLPDDTIHVKLDGSAGQSLAAFICKGITIEMEGDANDYVGKGLSGGQLIVYPSKAATFNSHENVIVGNACLYGATSGYAFIAGIAAERFCVRNSGATVVVEGVGDHGCEYMTGGRVVVLGQTGRNFAAGMSGGIAYILDQDGTFASKCNAEMVFLESVANLNEVTYLRRLIEEHHTKTGSKIAKAVLHSWMSFLPKFVKVYPHDYKAALERTVVVEPKLIEVVEVKKDEPVVLDLEDSVPDEAMLKKADKVRGFIKYARKTDSYRNAAKRAKDFDEINARLTDPELKIQAARCMDCGVPFCQSDSTGCPIGNVIPKWNDLVFNNRWKEALNRLLLTNNFPEFTGRVCPAPCEGSCVLGINEMPVAIKSIECAIIDKGYAEGWIVPNPPAIRTGKKVAIVGSGPAGLAAADQLNKAGHLVTVYDRNDRFGGLLMYGIPNMKLDKKIVQRRIDLMAAEGVTFIPNTQVGKTVDARDLQKDNDALVLATGATWPRDLKIPGRQLDGIHFAMEYLQSTTKSLLDSSLQDGQYMSVKNKHVIVIGGGDTGNDCIGTSVRLGAKSVVNFELLPQPPNVRGSDNPWPQYPRVFKLDYGHSEVKAAHGKDPREYQILSKEFVSDGNGRVKGINTVKVEWTKSASGRWDMAEVIGSEQFYEADFVFLSMGFLGPETEIIEQLEVKKDVRSNVQTAANKYMTSVEGVFAAGDCRRGQSLIVWGINEGRMAAREVDTYLMGNTRLPSRGGI
ncbi:glutamate synthase [NADH] [Physocladia obscura]|uniref:glutamate synthase (NADH) n=1 Tax=Physocladia obscura TaxID=109957 RepID=A0AAD5TAK0_9FUNG|nr:glutamate synthase [NADH] [Physocladia obscura]